MKPLSIIKSALGTRVGLITTVSAVVLLALLTALPFAAKHAALSWLMKNGMAEARIDDVDINPFAGALAVEGVHLLARTGEVSSLHRFSVNLAVTDLVKKRIRLESLYVSGLHLTVDQGKAIALGGLPLPSGDSESEAVPPEQPVKKGKKAWQIGIDSLTIRDTSVALATPKLSLGLGLDEVSLTRLYAWNPGQEARLEIKGALNQSPLLISLDLTPFAEDISIRGGLQLERFALTALHQTAAPHLTGLHGELTVDTRVALTHGPKTGTVFSQTGALSLHNLGGNLDDQGIVVKKLDISWLGDLWAALGPDGELKDLRSLGALANDRLDAVFSPMGLELCHNGVKWDGEVRFQPQPQDGLAVRGNLSVKEALVTDTQSGDMLAGLSHLFVYDLKANGLKKVRVPHISLKGLHTLPPFSVIGSVDVTGVALDDLCHLRADTFIIGEVATTLERDASGQLTFLAPLSALMERRPRQAGATPAQAPQPAEPDRPGSKEASAFSLKLNTFRIFGDHFLQFTDRSVTPVFKKSVTLKRLELLDIDTASPETDLPLVLDAELDTYETLFVTGTLRPLAPEVSAHLNARIANINLAPLSPYSSQAIGYLIETGNFSIDSDLKIDAGELDVTNQLTLHNIELVADDEEAMDRVMKNLTMPLDYALSILEDSHGTIRLAIPVRGDIHNPDISLDSIIRKAMAKAITTASVSYLSFLLQPYGALLMVAEKAGEMVTEIRLDPIAYEVGAIQPNEAGQAYLKVVAGLMKKKEVLTLTVCANAVTDDLTMEKEPVDGAPKKEPLPPTVSQNPSPAQPDDAPYRDLARERGKAIRDILIQEGIAPGRIHLCRPHFSVSEQETPEAVLAL